jgi:EmrB/QacA subfamily drug resistance transporter
MHAPSTPDPNRWSALYVLCVGVLMIVLDGTVVNVALPSIKSDLDFTDADLAWVVNAYMIAFGGLLLLAGRLGDLLGQRRVFLAGLVGFTIASLACALAPTQEVLVGARFLQGAFGAATSAVVLGMIVTMFAEPREQAKAIGVYGFVASAGGSIGLLVGGALTDAIDWRWIFLVNLPIGVGTAVGAWRLVADRPGLGLAQGADALGAVLVTAGLMLGVYAILGAAEDGWTAGRTLGFGAAAVVLVGLFVLRQARVERPLMPLALVRSRSVAGSNVVQVLTVAGMFGLFFLGALYLQRVLGYSPLGVGFAFLPATLLMGAMSLGLAERLNRVVGPGRTLVAGTALVALGMLLMARAPVDGDYATDVLPTMVLLGLGAGSAFPALMSLAMSGVAPQDSGLASGLVNMSAQACGAIGLAVLATLASDRTSAARAEGEAVAEALTSGYQLAFVVAAALIAAAAVLAAVVFRGAPGAGPRRDAEAPAEPVAVVA